MLRREYLLHQIAYIPVLTGRKYTQPQDFPTVGPTKQA